MGKVSYVGAHTQSRFPEGLEARGQNQVWVLGVASNEQGAEGEAGPLRGWAVLRDELKGRMPLNVHLEASMLQLPRLVSGQQENQQDKHAAADTCMRIFPGRGRSRQLRTHHGNLPPPLT